MKTSARIYLPLLPLLFTIYNAHGSSEEWSCKDKEGRVFLSSQKTLVDECRLVSGSKSPQEDISSPAEWKCKDKAGKVFILSEPTLTDQCVQISGKKTKKLGVYIGMSQDQVIKSSWGKPRKINKTTTAWGVSEQWVYDGGYLYFTDGVLTTIQN